MMKIFLALCVGAVLFAKTIELSPSQIEALGIETQRLQKINSISIGSFNAKVQQSQKSTHFLGAKLSGVVQEIYTHKYAHVEKGQRLLRLQSSELLILQKEYIDADMQSDATKKSYDRDVRLEKKGVVSKKRLLESKRLFVAAEVAKEVSAQRLMSYGISKEELQNLEKRKTPSLFQELTAPVSGQVFTLEVSLGELVPAQKNLIGIYAEGGKYLEIALPLSVAGRVSLGDWCYFTEGKARVIAVSDVVEESSQSVIVRAELQNPNASRIHQIYEVSIERDLSDAWKIEKSSLVFLDKKPYVFKRVPQGFELVSVSIVGEAATYYGVHSKLLDGSEDIAVSATAALLSAVETENE